MIREISGLVSGPYAPGQEYKFKLDAVAAMRKRHPDRTYLCIEARDSCPGFPDVLCLWKDGHMLVEFKVSDREGCVKFQKSQPLFYIKNPTLDMRIAAWDVRLGRMLMLDAADAVGILLNAGGGLKMKLPLEAEK